MATRATRLIINITTTSCSKLQVFQITDETRYVWKFLCFLASLGTLHLRSLATLPRLLLCALGQFSSICKISLVFVCCSGSDLTLVCCSGTILAQLWCWCCCSGATIVLVLLLWCSSGLGLLVCSFGATLMLVCCSGAALVLACCPPAALAQLWCLYAAVVHLWCLFAALVLP